MSPRSFLPILFVLAAFAQADPKVDNVFRVWDADKDGILTVDEIPDKDLFKRVDIDGDGKVTRAEVGKYFGVKVDPKQKKGGAGAAKKAKKKEPKSDARPVPEPRTVSERVADFFRRFDANKDKVIQEKEFRAGTEIFKKYDRNRSKTLTVREVRRYVRETLREAKKRPNRNNFFDLFDMNRDKKVTKKEYDGPPKFFRDHDHDKDRVVTRGELTLGPMGGMEQKGDKKLLADGPTKAPKTGLLARYDKDKDGRITLDELGGAELILRRLDKNRDGVLSGSEVR